MNKQEIIDKLKELLAPLKLHTAILFGSYAYGNPSEDSDIDILAVLDEEYINSYKAKRTNRLRIRKALAELNRLYPLDLLVYTLPEWNKMTASPGFFLKEITEKGVRI